LDDKTNTAVKKALSLAKKHGTITAFNAFDVKALKEHGDFFKDVIDGGLVDILFGNEDEMKTLFNKSNSDELFESLKDKPYTAVITRDKNGAVVVSKGKVTKIPCTPIEHIVDATGAGDSFVAGYLYAFCNGKDEYTCGKKGNEVAAVTVMQKGARPALTDEQRKFD
jgi:sugar/nucleoside kinase (ribokinase family)